MCVSPIILRNEKYYKKDFEMSKFPCGKCIECLQQRRNSWYVRLINELKHAENAIFLTLTYDNECITLTENNLPNLDYADLQRLWKKYRASFQRKHGHKSQLKYFAVGEYGAKTQRPHYHAIIFNVNQKLLEESWDYGLTHVGEVNEKSIFYTLKYCLKNTFKTDFELEQDDRTKEKAMMSKGLGLNYLTKNMVQYHKDDVTRGVTYLGNKKLPLPRYYRDKIFSETEKSERLAHMQSAYADKEIDAKLDPLYNARLEKRNNDVLKTIKKTD